MKKGTIVDLLAGTLDKNSKKNNGNTLRVSGTRL